MKSWSDKILPVGIYLLLLFPLSVQAGTSVIAGHFKGNGQAAKLTHAITLKGDPYEGKKTVHIFLSEKDPGTGANASLRLSAGELGSGLELTITEDGKLIGTQVYHTSHDKKPFSSIGKMTLTEFKKDGSFVQGKLSTAGEKEFFGQKWEVELSFKAKRI